MNSLRIGLIGAGGMGSFHARTLAGMPGVEVAVVADPFGDAAERLASELDATAMLDPMTLAASGAVDGLVIASPDETHAELSLAAMKAGTTVLCEKPLATSIQDAQSVMDFETDRGSRLLQLGFMREYDLAHVQVQSVLSSLGPIHHVRCAHLNTTSEARPIQAIVGQSMVHDLHTVRFITGAEVTSVAAHATVNSDGTVRHVIALCTLDTGAHAVLEFDDSGYAYEVVVEATALHGSASTGSQVLAQVRTEEHQRVHVGRDWFGRFADAYRLQDEAWIASLRSGRVSGPSSWDGLVAQTVVEAIIQGVATGATEPVALSAKPDLF